jgi:hypothetical protein
MIITNKEINDAIIGLDILFKEKYPVAFSYKLFLIKQNIEPYLLAATHAVNEVKKKYAKKDSEGNFICSKNEMGQDIPNTFVLESIETVNKEILDILNQEITIPDIKINLSEFPSHVLLSPEIFINLYKFIANQ